LHEKIYVGTIFSSDASGAISAMMQLWL